MELKDIPVGQWFIKTDGKRFYTKYSFIKDVDGVIWIWQQPYADNQDSLWAMMPEEYEEYVKYNEIFKTWENL